jgi:hypothetical protein
LRHCREGREIGVRLDFLGPETQGQVLNRAFELRRLLSYSTSDHQTDRTGVHARSAPYA